MLGSKSFNSSFGIMHYFLVICHIHKFDIELVRVCKFYDTILDNSLYICIGNLRLIISMPLWFVALFINYINASSWSWIGIGWALFETIYRATYLLQLIYYMY